MAQPQTYIRALNHAARLFRLRYETADLRGKISAADRAAIDAETAFDHAGLISRDYPGVQAAEKRYHDAHNAYLAWVGEG